MHFTVANNTKVEVQTHLIFWGLFPITFLNLSAEGGAGTAGFNVALVSSYPLLVFFASKAGKKS